jgi:hypothetical protein
MADDINYSIFEDLNKQVGAFSSGLNQQIKSTGMVSDAYREDAAQQKAMQKAQKELADSIHQAARGVVGFAKTLQGGNGSFQPLTDVISITTKAFGSLLGKLPLIGGALEGLSKGAGEVANMMIETYDKVYGSFEKLSDSGVVDSFTTFKNTANAMGMAMTSASESLEKRSKDLALFGGSAMQGTKIFAQIANDSRGLRDDFQKLGINSKDFTDFQISYINQQNILNRGKVKSNQDLINESANYMKELDAVSKLTGESRKALQSAREARNNEATLLSAMEKMSPKMRDEFNKFLDTVEAKGGKELSQAYGLMIARGGVVYGEASKKLQASAPEAASLTAKMALDIKNNMFNANKSVDQATEAADQSVKRNKEIAIMRSSDAASTALFVQQNKLATSKGKNIAKLDQEIAQTQTDTLKDDKSPNAQLAKTKRALENTQINMEQLATSSRLVEGLMNSMAEGLEKFTEKFYDLVGEDMPAHLKAGSEARKAIKEESDIRSQLNQAEKKELKLKDSGMSQYDPRRGLNLDFIEKQRQKLDEATKKKEQALERKRQADIQAGIIVGGATTNKDDAATPSAVPTTSTTTAPTAPVPSRYGDTIVNEGSSHPSDTGSPGTSAPSGVQSKLQNVKPEVLAKLAQLESSIGKKLIVTSGFRRGAANHGTGDAIDLGFGANPSLRNTEEQNKLFKTAIGLGFKGIGAEFSAPGGAHIHLDTTPSRNGVMGWGSDYTSKSLPRDSPYLANLINQQRRGGATTSPTNSARTGGIFSGPDTGYLTELHGDEVVAPVGKQALNTSMLTGLGGGLGGSSTDADFDAVYKQVEDKMDRLISVLSDTMKANKKQSQARFV